MRDTDTATAADYGVFVEYAYLMYAQNRTNLTPPPPADFTTVTGCEITAYLTCVDTFIDDATTQFYGYIARSVTEPTQWVIAIRGTEDFTEWFDDFEIWPVPFTPVPEAGQVEHGFFEIFQSMASIDANGQGVALDDLLATFTDGLSLPTIVIVGHSLGGAIATMFALAALNLQPDLKPLTTLYTLASPALGDATFAEYFDAQVPLSVRIWNEADIVPKALTFLYTHVDGAGQEIIQTPEQVAQIQATWACEHGLLTYLWLLDPNNPFAANFLASSCNQPQTAAATGRQALRTREPIAPAS